MMKKVSGALVAFLYTTSAMAATLMPNGQQQFIDANGKPYANGKVYFYSNFPTCSVSKNTYQDEASTILNSNPVTLDAAGRATIFGVGAYCQVLKDANGNTIWTKYTSDTSSASNLGWGGNGGGTANAQTVTVSGFSSVNGQTFYFIPSASNTTATTLSVNGGPAVSIVKSTPSGLTLLVGGEIVSGTVVGVTYVSATGQFNLITNNNTVIGYPGEVRTFAYAGCPAGWLAADGSSVSAATYPNLYLAIGTTWGTSAGNVVLPNFQNQFLRGDGTSVVGTYEADTYLNHNHAVTDPGHTHTYSQVVSGPTAFQAGPGYGTSSTNTGSNTTGLTVNTSTTGGTETRPKNYRVRFCVKF